MTSHEKTGIDRPSGIALYYRFFSVYGLYQCQPRARGIKQEVRSYTVRGVGGLVRYQRSEQRYFGSGNTVNPGL